jgi:hypothetical protein
MAFMACCLLVRSIVDGSLMLALAITVVVYAVIAYASV